MLVYCRPLQHGCVSTNRVSTPNLQQSNSIIVLDYAFSALTLLVGRQGGHPACKKTEWWGAGVVICLELGADLHMAQLMPLPLTVSCFSNIQIRFTFLVQAYPGSPGKGPLNGCASDSFQRLRFVPTILALYKFVCMNVCVCVCFRLWWLGSRMVSVLDSDAEGNGYKSQPRRCRVTVLGKLFTSIVPLFINQQKPVADPLRVAGVAAGLVESNGSLPPGL